MDGEARDREGQDHRRNPRGCRARRGQGGQGRQGWQVLELKPWIRCVADEEVVVVELWRGPEGRRRLGGAEECAQGRHRRRWLGYRGRRRRWRRRPQRAEPRRQQDAAAAGEEPEWWVDGWLRGAEQRQLEGGEGEEEEGEGGQEDGEGEEGGEEGRQGCGPLSHRLRGRDRLLPTGVAEQGLAVQGLRRGWRHGREDLQNQGQEYRGGVLLDCGHERGHRVCAGARLARPPLVSRHRVHRHCLRKEAEGVRDGGRALRRAERGRRAHDRAA
mmetsp:Transcript_16944/g.39652  ORF Transcript_16944/g.39652 Transcript_16944/m.39652 type:complete len:272 (+) Transcript_16944:1590-2405(+)